MRISLNWLKEYIDLDVPVDELTQTMTLLGMEVESVERPGEAVQGVVTGKVLERLPHPQADKLSVCKTDVGGEEPLQIVCGASNYGPGDIVPVAVVGATLPGGLAIKRAKLRGVESQGMMCSARELGLGDDHDGLYKLPPNTPLGADIRGLLGLDDVIIEIEITPNRGDWAGMLGIARDLAAHYGKEVRRPQVHFPEAGAIAADSARVDVEDPERCARYCGRLLRNVTVAPSPDWLKNRLIAAGQRPINNIVDITNYVLLETGHPLHAFDHDKLAEGRIVVRTAKAGERILTIDQVDRALDPAMLVIADAEAPVAVAGVMGGFDSEVTETTRTILLESAHFAPATVRKTARTLNLASEASQRFQRNADIDMAPYALDRAAQLIHELAGAEVAPGVIDVYPAPRKPVTIALRFARTNALLGTAIAGPEQGALLERLGFRIVGRTEEGCNVEVPSWRPDCAMEADLIEEIVRLYGYANVQSALPRVSKSATVYAPLDSATRDLRRFLVGLGLTELVTLTFLNEGELARLNLDGLAAGLVRLENPLSENHAVMRPALIPSLVAIASHNVRHGNRNLALFEIGSVYRESGAELPAQSLRLAVLLTGDAAPAHWGTPGRKADLFDIKGIAEAVLTRGDAKSAEFAPTTWGPFQPGQTAEVIHSGHPMGWLGQLAPGLAKGYDLDAPVFAFEIELDTLLGSKKKAAAFAAIPAFPESVRDLAVVVDGALPAGDLAEAARKVGGKLLKRVELIDIYCGKPIPDGKKSVALSLVFQAPDKTLTDKETEKAWGKIVEAFKREHGAELR